MASTRAFGTGLPLTTATFCAWAAMDARPAAASTMLAAKTLCFMVERVPFRPIGGFERTQRGLESPAGRARSGGLGNGGVDRRGGDAARHRVVRGIIYEPMTGDAAEALEAGAGDRDTEVASLARAGVPGMQVAVVDDLERFGCERG